jgi:hypothetical protein
MSKTLIKAILCQLLMLGLLSYGLNLHCTFSPTECDDACCSNCLNPAHRFDTPAGSVQIKVVLAPQPFEAKTLLAEATALTGLTDYVEDQMLFVPGPCLPIECVRGPPAQA